MIGYLPPKKRTGTCRCHKTTKNLEPRSARLTEATASETPASPLCRHDFLEALRLLGTRRNDRRLRCTENARLMLPVHVSCSLERWVAAIGEPEDVREYKTHSMHLPVTVWRQSCIDGPVTCIGHLFQRADGERWVTVVRVGIG